MPAGAARSPRALPGGFAGFGGLPEREVQRALLVAGRTFFGLAHLFGALLTQLAVARVAFDVVVDVSVAGSVGVARLDQVLYQRDHAGYVLGGPRLHVRKADPEKLQALVEGVGVAAHYLLPRDAFFVGLVDDLVLDVRDVLDERHVVAPAPEIPHDHVPEQRRAGVADVDVVVDRGPADVESDPAALPHLHGASAQIVPYLYAHALSLASLARSILPRASSAPNTAKRYAISGPRSRPVSASLKGCRRSRVFIPSSLAQARSSRTSSRPLSRSSIFQPSRTTAACAKTASLDSGSSWTKAEGFTGPVISRTNRGASESNRISSRTASTARSSLPSGRGSSRKGSSRS